jgi:hypothetical protein
MICGEDPGRDLVLGHHWDQLGDLGGEPVTVAGTGIGGRRDDAGWHG